MKTIQLLPVLAALATVNSQKTDYPHTNTEIADMVAKLNEARAVVGSCPVEWDANLALEAAQQNNIVTCQGNPDWTTYDKDGMLFHTGYTSGDPITPAKWLEVHINTKAYWDLETVPQTTAKKRWFGLDVYSVEGCHEGWLSLVRVR